MSVFEIPGEPEFIRQVVGPQLDRGFAHFVGRFRKRPAELVDESHTQVRMFQLQLAAERQPGQSATANDDIETIALSHCYGR